MVFGPTQSLNSLTTLSALRVDVLRNRCGANEAQSPNFRGLNQRIDRLFVAMNHVQDTLW
ncbi:hypothetical protein D9M71_842980 [compost metagenome]